MSYFPRNKNLPVPVRCLVIAYVVIMTIMVAVVLSACTSTQVSETEAVAVPLMQVYDTLPPCTKGGPVLCSNPTAAAVGTLAVDVAPLITDVP
jgi:hypothetical protein